MDIALRGQPCSPSRLGAESPCYELTPCSRGPLRSCPLVCYRRQVLGLVTLGAGHWRKIQRAPAPSARDKSLGDVAIRDYLSMPLESIGKLSPCLAHDSAASDGSAPVRQWSSHKRVHYAALNDVLVSRSCS